MSAPPNGDEGKIVYWRCYQYENGGWARVIVHPPSS
jgi:hypothetical protein